MGIITLHIPRPDEESMTSVVCTWVPSPEHRYLDHPERPERLRGLERWRQETALPLVWLPVTPATEEDVYRVHHPAMWERLQSECAIGPRVIDYAPTYVTPSSCRDALHAAGGVLTALRAILEGRARRGFAIVRPPGHHATRTVSMGFCLLNNVAMGAAYALDQGLERVAIVDFDAHHGNGTEAIFVREERVGFLSLHQWGIYPGTGALEDHPHARGRIVNVPLEAFTGDQGYARLFEEVVVPWLERWHPQLLLVSAGFDAHWQDPLTQLGLSAAGFARLARYLVQAADALGTRGVLFVLEGGYHPPAVAASIQAVLHTLAEADLPQEAGQYPSPYPEPDVADLVHRVRTLHGLS